jgi:signal transduction histidine kinase
MMDWLQNLANGSYTEPTDRHGIPKSKLRVSRGLRRPYRMYQDVIAALEHLAYALQRGDIQRKRLEQTREEWIAGITHDLRTPLSSVKGYGELFAWADYEWTDSEIRQAGHVISEKATYMDGLVEDLGLTFRLRNDALPLQIEPENIIEVARNVVIALVNHPRSEGQTVEFESETDELIYPFDVRWFARALDNLVVNASLHNPVGTTITVSIQSHPHESLLYPDVHIEIRDDGIGMNEEAVSHLFDRYYRGTNTSEEDVKGSGLGTAIAKQLIEAQGGHVSVTSAVGRGTTVMVELPAQN